MNSNKILLAGLVGGIVSFLLGFLVYGLLLSDFFASNAGSATGVARGESEMLWIPLVSGNLVWGLFFAFVFGRWANISTFATGTKAGGILGLLVALTYSLINLGTTHIMTPTAAIVDIILATITAAIIGGVVGWLLGRGGAKLAGA